MTVSQTVVLSVGIFVFAFTVWGSVLAGGIWLGQIAESEDERARPRPETTDPSVDEVGGTPHELSSD